MDIGAILTVVFGLIVLGWMIQAFFPKTHKKVHDKLDNLIKDDEDKNR